MCSVRLLIRVVRMAICTSGEPESLSVRRCSWINSRFRSLVTVIADRKAALLAIGRPDCRPVACDASPYAASTSRTIFKIRHQLSSRSIYQRDKGLQGRKERELGAGGL